MNVDLVLSYKGWYVVPAVFFWWKSQVLIQIRGLSSVDTVQTNYNILFLLGFWARIEQEQFCFKKFYTIKHVCRDMTTCVSNIVYNTRSISLVPTVSNVWCVWLVTRKTTNSTCH